MAERAPTTQRGHKELGGVDAGPSDLTAALMQAYLSGNGAEVERVMALMAQEESGASPRASAA